MADGVAPGDVYKTLATSDGVDRAFRKLDQLKPYIHWWSTEAEAAHILASGDVLMTSAPSGQIATTAEHEHKNFGLQFGGSLFELQSWVIMKGSPSARIAQQFLYFTGMPAVEAAAAAASGDAGLAKGVNDGLTPELARCRPAARLTWRPGCGSTRVLARQPRQAAAAIRRLAGALIPTINEPQLRRRFACHDDAWAKDSGHPVFRRDCFVAALLAMTLNMRFSQ